MSEQKELAEMGALSGDESELLSLLLAEEGLEVAGEQAVSGRARAGESPLSFAQQRLWFLNQWQPESPAYNVPIAVRLSGRLDAAALELTLNEIVRRHEVLRTTFKLSEGRPVQVIAPVSHPELPVVDLRHLPEAEREAEARRLSTLEARRPFDLTSGPVLRAHLLRLGDENHVALLVMHHIVSDAWSRGVLIGEVAALYQAFSKGDSSPLAELPLQYADYAAWQRERLEGEVLQTQLSYWRRQLAHAPVLELPTDRPRPAMQTFRGAQHVFTLERGLGEALKVLCLREGATLFMTLSAAFKLLLSRYSAQHDIAVGTPVSGRTRAEFESLIGFFLNTLVLRTDLSGDPTVRELVAREREVCLEAYARQDVPFERLVEELQPERDLTRTPLFQVMLVVQNASQERLQLPGVSLSAVPVENDTAKFDLTLVVEESPQGLVCSLEYNRDLFEARTIARMAGHFERLLARMLEDPEQKISRLSLLGEEEQRQILVEWNDTAVAYPRGLRLHQLFEAQVSRTPDSTALVFGGERLSYRELNERANRLAHHLRALGVAPDTLVGVLMERSVEMVVSLLGVLKAGGAYLPLDPEYPHERLSFMLSDAHASVLLTQERLRERCEGEGARVVCLDTQWAEVAAHGGDNLVTAASPESLAYVIYTSGSTGTPKAAMNAHSGIVNRLLWMQHEYGLSGEDTVLQKTPYGFDVSVWEFFWPLMAGARLVVAEPGGHRDPRYLRSVIESERVTTAHFVPSMLHAFLEGEGLAEGGCPTLRRVICSGEALSAELAERFLASTGAELHNLYGPTEAAVDVTAWACARGVAKAGAGVPIGRPVANTRIYILDGWMRPVPAGVSGELYIGGVQVGRGYLKRPALTAERYVPDPFSTEPGARLYRTGDVARHLSGGEVEYVGRIDHQVKVRGFRIELGEIESALGRHPSVKECAVEARGDGAGGKRLVAYMVGAGEGQVAKASELREYLNERLPEYMVPSVFVWLDELPLSPNGKLDRRALPEPSGARPEAEEPYVAPGTLVEEVLAGIWSEVLGVEQVGINDNYFALGGDSIRSLRVLALAREKGMEFTLQQLFRKQTVAELARELKTGAGPAAAKVDEPFGLLSEDDRAKLPPGLEDAYPLTTLQAGMFYHMRLMPDSSVYHNVNTWHLRARFDRGAFEEAVRRVVARHPVLRTSFDLATYGEPLQLVHSEAALPVLVEDLRSLPTDEQDAVLEAFIEGERRNHFDLARAPLLRFFIHLRGDDTFQFSLTESHPVNDGWSLTSTLAEVFGSYFALLDGEDPPRQPPPSVTFRDYVAAERHALNSEECRGYWDEKLSGSTVMRLPRWPAAYRPYDGPRFYEVRVPVSEELTRGLQRVARAAKVPLKSVLLAAHLKVLSVVGGQSDVLGGIASNGRSEEAGGDDVRGLFLNTLPFRLDVSGGTWLDLIKRTFEAEWEMLPYRRYPLVALQRRMNGQPLFETQFNYVHFHALEGVLGSGKVEILASSVKGVEETHFTLEADFGLDLHSSRVYLTAKGDATQLGVEQIEAAAGYYERALIEIASDPTARHDGACLLAPKEQRRLLLEWNDTAADYPSEKCLHELFEGQAKRTPESVAVVYDEERVTYGELNARANQLAHHLRALGVGAETRVGVCLERSIEMVVGLLAVLKAGGAYVPLDAQYPSDRLAFMLEDAEASVVLTQESLLGELPESAARVLCLERHRADIDACSEADPERGAVSGNLAYLIYTSGSTGRPKGVAIEHRSANAFIHWAHGVFAPAELAGVLASTSISFDLSVFEIFAPLTCGGALVLAENALQLPGLRAAHEVTLLNTVPSAMNELLRVEGVPASVRTVNLAGEPLTLSLAQGVYELPTVERLFNLYGPSEDTTYSTWSLLERRDATPPTIGRPIANTQVYILDDAQQPSPVGVPGELYIGGEGLARGYLNRPELTAERFVPDPFSDHPGARLYRTGDLSRYLSGGEIEFLGRLDHQVKIRGFRIELGEVEAALRGCAGVREAIVMAREDGAAGKRLVAYVVVAGEALAVGELRKQLQQRLPDYMVPTAFVTLDALPLTPSGKVDRRALPEPGRERPEMVESYAAPQTPTQELVATLYGSLLGVERVGLNDNFFDLGGHSLLATQLVSRLREAFGVELPLRSLFESPTVAALADRVDELIRSGAATLPPLLPVERQGDTAPLSYAQERLWFIEQLEPGTPLYNIPAAVRLRGTLDIEALSRSLVEVVRRHESLRTTFKVSGGRPVQVIAEAGDVALPVRDLSPLPEGERQAELERLAAEEARRPFDLAAGPLLRAMLLRLADDEHVVVLVMHHIISDGWSMGVLVRELTALYAACSRGEESALATLPLQYADYAIWQREHLTGAVLEEQLSYWRGQLAGVPVLELPTDRPHPAVRTHAGATHTFAVPGVVSERLKELSRREGATLYMTLLACFQLLLSRYTGQTDIAVGTPSAGRTQSEVEGLVGFFVNTLVVRAEVSGRESFRALVGRVRESVLGAFARQDVPFEKLVEELQPERSLGRAPLFQVMFALQNAPQGELKLPGIELSRLPVDTGTAKFDLFLALEEGEGGRLDATLEYSTDLFDEATVTRMAGHFRTLLEGVVADPDSPARVLPLLTDAEERQLSGWNLTAAEYERGRCVHELFEEQAKRTPEAVAVTFEGVEVGYAELNARANQLAHYLRSLGVAAETRVGLCVERSPEMLVGLLAVLKAGGAYVPLDPTYPRERLSFMLEDSGVSLLLTQKQFADALPASPRLIFLDADRDAFARESAENLDAGVALPENVAYVLYTSGSTGRPKGVTMCHRALSNLISWQLRHTALHAGARTLQFASLNFDVSFQEVFATWRAGGTLVLVAEDLRRDPKALVQYLSDEKVERLFLPFVALQYLAEAARTLTHVPLHLREVVTAGEQLHVTPAVAELFTRLEGCSLHNQYGPTESHVVTAHTLEGVPSLWATFPPIGVPVANTQIHLLDSQLRRVPVGVPGELYIGGDALARGYLNRPELTAERFTPDPFSREPGARLYRTGDLARYLSGGEIEFLGRLDHQVKIRGFRVELGEVEAALGRHPGVTEGVVVAREDAGRGTRLVAYLVADRASAPTAVELREFMQKSLPDYMVPTAFVTLDTLPLTPSGKVDRRALPAPAGSDLDASGVYVAPRTPSEGVLASLYGSLLGVERVGLNDNFFDLGGHSLLATQLVSRLREAFQVELPLRTLFESPTVRGLAERVEELLRSGAATPPPLLAVERDQTAPLSYAQERLWFIDQLEPGSVAYNIPAAVRLRGTLDIEALSRSLVEVVRRHEVLRTTFKVSDGRPVQVVAEAGEVVLPVSDLSLLVEGEREAEAERLAGEEARRPFDLAAGPLLRARLLRLADDEHLLVVVMHHIISDGWSLGVVVRELSELYAAYSHGEEPALAELSVQYADYAVWQREHLTGAVLEEQLSYWRERLRDAPVLELPTDRPRPARRSGRGASLGVELPAGLREELEGLARSEGATLYMTLLAAFQLLLSRYTGQTDIAVGTPSAGRTQSEVEGLVGFFVNTLVVRADLSGGPSFCDALGRVRESVLGAFARQDVPFEKLVEELQPERSLGHAPLFQVMFALQNTPRGELKLGAVEAVTEGVGTGTAKFDLLVSVEESEGGALVGRWEYDAELFDEATVTRMAGHFRTLLEGVVADPDSPARALPLLTEAEGRQLSEWNRTGSEYERGRCVHELFEEQAKRTPEAVAVVHGEERVTYAELNARVNQLAHHLRSLGVAAETRVGVCLERSIEMVVGLLAVLKAGGAYVPLDAQYPSERLAFMLEDTGARVLLTEEALVGRLPAGGARVVCLEDCREEVGRQSAENPAVEMTSDCLVYIMYTSGSTGRPKGVCVTHRNVARLVRGTDYAEFGPEEVMLQFATTSFDASTFELWGSLLHGGRLVLMPSRTPTLEELGRALSQYGVTTLWLTAGLFHQMVDERPDDLRGVRQLLAGGDVLSVPHVRKLLGEPGGVRLINGYGPTESTTFACCHTVSDLARVESSVPIGRPIANTQVYLLDPHLRPVPVGVAGELYIGGDGLARGYLNRPELTAERFVPDPFSREGGGRLYRTGDSARYLPDGVIEFLGRLDQQVKVRGFRVELGEVESVLRTHAAVRDGVVLARDAQAGGDKRLVAYFLPEEGRQPTTSELRAHMQEKLPDYMVPSAFVALEEFPLTPNGKVDRAALPEPGQERPELAQAYAAPRTPTQELVASLYGSLLGVERVGAHDDFFDLGGHSLLATQLVSRLREAFGVELPLRSLFESPTVAGLADGVDELIRSGAPPAPPLLPAGREGDTAPLSYAQERLWFLDQLEPGSDAYNIPAAVRLRGALDIAALSRSLAEVVRRHESLRTTFKVSDGRPAQIISGESALELPLTDLSALAPAMREAEAERLAGEEARRPFDLTAGPLLRARLLRLADDEHVVVLVIHHIISDGWSLGVLVRELSELYDAFARGEESALAELPVQYADYAVWQREHLRGEALGAQLAYWRRRLEGVPMLELPSDRPRRARPSGAGGQLRFELPEGLREGLERVSRSEGATLFMTLLAAFQVLLGRWSGQEDVAVGAPVAGRTRAEVEGLIGFFVNTLVLRTDLSGGPSFREVLGRVREAVLGAYAHQEVPFEAVVEELRPERSLSHAPLFQVFFNMLNLPKQEIELRGLAVEVEAPAETSSKFDLTLYVREQGGGLVYTLVYDADLFDEARMVELSEQYVRLLAQVVENPEERVERLSLLTPRAAALLPDPREELNADIEEPLLARLSRQARRSAGRPALIDGDEVWTYRELGLRSNQLANFLRAGGVGANDVVAVYGHRSASLVWAVLGVLKAGAAFVILDPAYPSARLIKYLDIAKPVGWIQLEAAGVPPAELEKHVEGMSPRRRVELPRLAEAVERGTLEGQPLEEPELSAGPDDLAYVAFTSGSTGEPKGIAGLHAPLAHFLRWHSRTFELSEADRFSMASGLAHDPLLRDIFTPLWLGATLCVPEQDGAGLTPRLAAWMKRERISVTHLVPALAQLLAASGAHGSADTEGGDTLDALRYVFLSGDALTAQLVSGLQSLAPSATCVNFYGATETPQAMSYFVVPRAKDDASGLRGVVPVGRGIEDAQLLVLNGAGQLCGVGEPGEICIRTPFLARGYVGDDALTSERFNTNPFTGAAGDRIYRTGDVGRYLPDGNVEFHGRYDRQLKVRGFRIEPGEIEAALARCPGVGQAVLVAFADEPGESRLVAYVVAEAGGASPSAGELRTLLRESLPEYMIPSAFVTLDELPLTPNGKVDRSALPAAPGAARAGSAEAYVAPRTATEEILAEMWSRLLRVGRVGVHDNFFELGGHSLLAAQLMLRVQEALAVEVALRWLFESPTVAGLAEIIERALGSGERTPLPPIRTVPREQDLPLSFAQERIWILDQLEPGNSFFNIHQAVRLKGRLDASALEQSLDQVVARHEALRATIQTRDGRPFVSIREGMRLTLPVVDISGLPEAEREAEARRLAGEEAKRAFDLTRGPLLRASLLRLGEEEHVVLLTLHHVVADGWSVGVLVGEAITIYEALTHGRAPALAELPVQYVDYAAWQRDWLSGEALGTQLAYWEEKLAGAPARIELPTDHTRPSARTMRGARHSLALPDTLVESLRELSRKEGATLFITMLTALKIALFKWTRQRDLVVGTVTANRSRLETERLIGCFVNFAALRTEVSEDETAAGLLRRVKAGVLEMYAHQDCPFEKIVEAINPERGANQNPLYNVAFLMQNFPRTYAFGDALEASVIETEHDASLLDLRLVAEEYAEGVQLWCEYSTELFEARTVEQFVAHYLDTLGALARRPETEVAAFSLPAELEERAARAVARERTQTIAVASTFTAEPVEDALDFWMKQLDIPARYEFAPYNQVFQQLLDSSSLLGQNRDGVNVVLIRFEDWGRYLPGGVEGRATVPAREDVERNVRDLLGALGAAASRSASPILVCVCPASPAGPDGRDQLFRAMEDLLASEIEGMGGVHLVTTSELAATYPVANYYDAHADGLGHVPYTPAFFTALGTMIARKIRALKAAPYKVVVLDCDDTLWGGVCGEDGAAGVEVDDARRALQEFVVAQHDRGMLVCLCSKNNEEDVAEVFRCRAGEMPLRREHIAAWRVNWEPKSENLKSLAEELRLGLDSFIFIDNDPVVCLEAQANCPEVLTLQLPAEADKIHRFLRHVWAFDRLKVTDEDRQRTALYRQHSRRESLRESSLSLSDFLAAIELRVRISELRPEHVARVAQLTQRTNQFNCTGVRRDENEVRRSCLGGQFECLVVEVSDRFGDYGTVGAIVFEAGAEAVEVDTFLLSCRALGRGVEHRMLARLGEFARASGLSGVNVRFVSTGRNQPALDFLSRLGGSKLPTGDGWTFSFTADYAASLATNLGGAAQTGEEHFTAGETAPNDMAIATSEE